MNSSLKSLCEIIKAISSKLKRTHNSLSFLLLIGKSKQGKTTLLQQGKLIHYPIDAEVQANCFYNQYGIILELGENWLANNKHLLGYSLKQLNNSHYCTKISGIILCIDSQELLLTDPTYLLEKCKANAQLLERFGRSLAYKVPAAIFFSKLDALAGFCEFFQTETAQDILRPLGFSLNTNAGKAGIIDHYRQQFDNMLALLNQQVINKLHPARSSVRRNLIREFPIQLSSLQIPALSIIQNLSPGFISLQAMYFTSAEQGGLNINILNKKMQDRYALTIQDKFSQSYNYRAYFIEGALRAFQVQTAHSIARSTLLQQWLIGLSLGFSSLTLVYLGWKHINTYQLLDEVSKELIIYETVNDKYNRIPALYHLSQATAKLAQIPSGIFSIMAIEQLKEQLNGNTRRHLQQDFLPYLLDSIEKIILDASQSQSEHYQALKIYLMLNDPKYYNFNLVTNWFSEQWKHKLHEKALNQQMLLLENVLRQPLQPIEINKQLVRDTRNYLNALPATYFYYTVAKNNFPNYKKSQDIIINGFQLSSRELPFVYTKEGFKEIIAVIPGIADKLQQENWVLARQDLTNLAEQLEQAYCLEYITWWRNFIMHCNPLRYLDYQQGYELAKIIHNDHSFETLIQLIQQHTAPDPQKNLTKFNQKIASEFMSLNLIGHSALSDLTQYVYELEEFLRTLSFINDQGHTVFNLTKSHFEGKISSNPVSNLFNKVNQLPQPLSGWLKQIVDDTWSICINESKQYLNLRWKEIVYDEYLRVISNRYPLNSMLPNAATLEVTLTDFDHFFAPHGTLNTFVNNYLKPFLDTSSPQWQAKEMHGYIMPIAQTVINELIRSNVITNMFFDPNENTSKINFSLQKINLDPVITNFNLTIGNKILADNQNNEASIMQFNWPLNNIKLNFDTVDGHHYELKETGVWALFKLLQKLNVLVDSEDSTILQILFEVNGNSGRYLLKTQNQINPFSPGILTGFNLKEAIV